MSHPVPGRTYEDDILDNWSEEELSRLWEMYVEDCKRSKLRVDMSDFLVWLEERI